MGSILHRTTKELRTGISAMSTLTDGTPRYNPAVYVRNPDLSAVEGVPNHYWVIESDDSVREADVGEKAAIDAARLPDIKAALVLKTDSETERRIRLGFHHSDPNTSDGPYVFSLSDNAQRTYSGAMADADGRIAKQASLPQGLPMLWPDKDDQNVITFVDANQLRAFCTASFDAVHERKLAGALTKISIAQAGDEATAQAAYDAYVASPEPI
jgi:hypothetical protein